jgi:hypothetical protein
MLCTGPKHYFSFETVGLEMCDWRKQLSRDQSLHVIPYNIRSRDH